MVLHRLAGARQPVDGVLGLRLQAGAVVVKAALKGVKALSTGGQGRCTCALHHGLGLFHPTFHLIGAGKGFFAQVAFTQQALVVALARVSPATVDVRHRNRGKCEPGFSRHAGLDGGVIAVVILDAGGRFDFHHAPAKLIAFIAGQQHIGKGQRTARTKTCLKNRLAAVGQQVLGAGKGGLKAFGLWIDQLSLALRVIQLAGNVTHLVPRGKTGKCRARVRAQFGLVHLQPKAFGALPKGQEFGFGEGAHRQEERYGASRSAGHRFAGDEDQRKVVRRPGPDHRFAQYLGLRQCRGARHDQLLQRCTVQGVVHPVGTQQQGITRQKGGNAVVDVKVGILAVCRQARVQRVVDGGVFLAFFGLATRNHAAEDGVVA